MAGTNKLTRLQFVALVDWVRAHKDGLAEGKRTLTDWANQASKEALEGVHLSGDTLAKACRDLGVEYKSPSVGGWERTQTAVQREIEQSLAEDRARMQRIEGSLQSIHQEMKTALSVLGNGTPDPTAAAKVRQLEAEVAKLRAAVTHLYNKLNDLVGPAPAGSGLVTVGGVTRLVDLINEKK